MILPNSAIARDSRTAALALVQRRYQTRNLRSKVTEGHRQVILAIHVTTGKFSTEIASEIFARTLIPQLSHALFVFPMWCHTCGEIQGIFAAQNADSSA